MPALVAKSTPGCCSCCKSLLLHKVFRAAGCVLIVRLRRSCHNWLRALQVADHIVHHMPMRPMQAQDLQPCSPSATMWCRATSRRRSWAASQRQAPWRSRSPTSCSQRCAVPAVLWSLWREVIPAGPVCSSLVGVQGQASFNRHAVSVDKGCMNPSLSNNAVQTVCSLSALCLVRIQIQAVARPPAALNGRKGVTAAFSTIGIMYPLVAVSGFYVRARLDCSLVPVEQPICGNSSASARLQTREVWHENCSGCELRLATCFWYTGWSPHCSHVNIRHDSPWHAGLWQSSQLAGGTVPAGAAFVGSHHSQAASDHQRLVQLPGKCTDD